MKKLFALLFVTLVFALTSCKPVETEEPIDLTTEEIEVVDGVDGETEVETEVEVIEE